MLSSLFWVGFVAYLIVSNSIYRNKNLIKLLLIQILESEVIQLRINEKIRYFRFSFFSVID